MQASTNIQQIPRRSAGHGPLLVVWTAFLLSALLVILLAAGCSKPQGAQQALEDQQQQHKEVHQKVDEPQSQKHLEGSEQQSRFGNVDRSSPDVIWSVSPKESRIPQAEVSALLDALEARDFGRFISSNRDLEITSGSVEGDKGVLYGQLRYHASQKVVPSDGVTLLIHKVAGRWQVTTGMDKDYCELLQQLPLSVMSEAAKDYSVECRRQ